MSNWSESSRKSYLDAGTAKDVYLVKLKDWTTIAIDGLSVYNKFLEKYGQHVCKQTTLQLAWSLYIWLSPNEWLPEPAVVYTDKYDKNPDINNKKLKPIHITKLEQFAAWLNIILLNIVES